MQLASDLAGISADNFEKNNQPTVDKIVKRIEYCSKSGGFSCFFYLSELQYVKMEDVQRFLELSGYSTKPYQDGDGDAIGITISW